MKLTLDRFRSAHAQSYETALQEVKSGKKKNHWIYFIFPQICGLGHSAQAQYFEIQGKSEAAEYWNDPVLRSHLIEITGELMKLNPPIEQIMDYPDNLKLRSCMTLFWLVTGEQLFMDVLEKFFHGSPDEYTLRILSL